MYAKYPLYLHCGRANPLKSFTQFDFNITCVFAIIFFVNKMPDRPYQYSCMHIVDYVNGTWVHSLTVDSILHQDIILPILMVSSYVNGGTI